MKKSISTKTRSDQPTVMTNTFHTSHVTTLDYYLIVSVMLQVRAVSNLTFLRLEHVDWVKVWFHQAGRQAGTLGYRPIALCVNMYPNQMTVNETSSPNIETWRVRRTTIVPHYRGPELDLFLFWLLFDELVLLYYTTRNTWQERLWSSVVRSVT